ncbi:ribosome maturation factor RimP [Rickettsia endosymbiont of Halotydeus destructor]|uniref:ribosome maturation factor RimP n=1 Tax=Rickettsia endosymbiont of Halotydeus destructor TaxID=2996754 RepID=UPI003BAF405D
MQTIEQQITGVIEETLTTMGFELVIVRLRGMNFKILEILIDRLDGEKVTVEDCGQVSQNISAILDVEDIIDEAYNLEVSSSGVERPLVKFADYNRFSGREVNIKLKALLNGKTRYQGKIIKGEDNKIYINFQGEEVILDFDLIKNASLVLTDEMFKELLDKK